MLGVVGYVAYELHGAPHAHVEARERYVVYYLPQSGEPAPFGVWRDSLSDVQARAKVSARIARFRGGNLGDSLPIGNGASESRIDWGPGLRIYYGEYGKKIVLLGGGDKSTQDADIPIILDRWEDYRERTRQNAKKPKLQG